jgi:hypothetical protein
MLPAKFGSIWPSSFRGEDFFNSSQSETRIAWLMLKKSSPLKLLGQIKPILAGSIYVRSSIKLLHLVPFGEQTWPPRAILSVANQKQELLLAAVFVGQMERNEETL